MTIIGFWDIIYAIAKKQVIKKGIIITVTKYFNWKDRINEKELKQCADIINNDGIIVFPTETVYGIAANALSKKAVQKIYLAKGRPADNPIIVHIAEKKQIEEICIIENEMEQKLIDKFMPGPFTLILKKKNVIPDIVSAKLDTVGIRMPANIIANKFIEECGVPIAAPSANVSGKPSGTIINDIKNELDGKVDAIIDGGISDIGLESTVVKVINGVPEILRPGKVTREDIINEVGIAKINDKVLQKVEKQEKVESPGMKYRHYAPNTKCILIDISDEKKQINKVNEIVKENNNVCVIGFKEHKDKINCDKYIEISSIKNLEEFSKRIYTELRKVDKYNVSLVIIEGVSKSGLGLAIMNRLIRTCEYNIITDSETFL